MIKLERKIKQSKTKHAEFGSAEESFKMKATNSVTHYMGAPMLKIREKYLQKSFSIGVFKCKQALNKLEDLRYFIGTSKYDSQDLYLVASSKYTGDFKVNQQQAAAILDNEADIREFLKAYDTKSKLTEDEWLKKFNEFKKPSDEEKVKQAQDRLKNWNNDDIWNANDDEAGVQV